MRGRNAAFLTVFPQTPKASCLLRRQDHINDTRESPAIRICRGLLEEGAVLAVVDPRVSERQIAADLGMAPGSGEGSWHLVADVNQAASDADALLLLTEWPQFAALDWAELAPL